MAVQLVEQMASRRVESKDMWMVDEMVAGLVGRSAVRMAAWMVSEMAERMVGTMDRWRVELKGILKAVHLDGMMAGSMGE